MRATDFHNSKHFKYWACFTEHLMKLPKVPCHQKKNKAETIYSGLKVRHFRRCSLIHGHNGLTRQHQSRPFPHLAVFKGPKCTPWADRALLKSAHGIVVERSFPQESWFIISPKGLESWQQLRENFRNQKLALKHVHRNWHLRGMGWACWEQAHYKNQ